MGTVDRAAIVVAEIAKCHPAHWQDGGRTIGAVYLPSDSIGVIVGQVVAMRLENQKLEREVERLGAVMYPGPGITAQVTP